MVIDQGLLMLLGAVLALVLQFIGLYATLKRAISVPIERELTSQMTLVKQQIDTIREDIKAEHNGLGARVSPLELGAQAQSTRLAAIEREEGLVRERHGYMSEKIGALEANQRAAEANLQKLANDLTVTIVESGRAQTNALNELRLQFAKFEERHTTERRVRQELRQGRRRDTTPGET